MQTEAAVCSSGQVYKSGPIELRCGRWQDVLADVQQVDAVITDPPYSERTHGGHDIAVKHLGSKGNARRDCARRSINYGAWSCLDVAEFAVSWSARCRGWIVALTSHDLVPDYAEVLDEQGRYVFPPLPFVAPGSRVRLAGDGPSSWTCWVVVARPRTREASHWGTLPGAYVLPPGQSERMPVVGGKPLWLMRALIRDYTRPGDLIVDPCAGGATTLLAAAMEGRRAIGSEADPDTYVIAVERLKRGYTPSLFAGVG